MENDENFRPDDYMYEDDCWVQCCSGCGEIQFFEWDPDEERYICLYCGTYY